MSDFILLIAVAPPRQADRASLGDIEDGTSTTVPYLKVLGLYALLFDLPHQF